jgi:hypothetical protein
METECQNVRAGIRAASEPPAVLAQDGSTFRTATPTRNCEQQTLAMTAAGSDGMDLVQLQALDRILLARLSQLDSFLAIFDVWSRQKLNHYKGRGIENRCSEDLPPFRAF